MNKPGISWKMAVWMGLCVMGCGKKQDDAAFTANIFIAHYVLNADSLRVFYDDALISGSRSLSYGATTARNGTAYTRIGAGAHHLSILAGNDVVKQGTVVLQAGKYYSLLLYDSIKNGTLRSALIEDPFLPNDTLTKFRFINAIPGNDTLTVSFTKDTTIAGSDIYIGRKPSAAYAYAALRPGPWQLSLLRGSTVLQPPAGMQLQAGKLYTVIAGGLKGGAGVYKERLLVVANN